MKFMYLGEGTTVVFGLTFKAGEAVEVTDAHAIRKLTANHLFAHNDEPAPVPVPTPADTAEQVTQAVAAVRRGRPPKAKPDAVQ